MNRKYYGLALVLALGLPFTVGCATKKHVREQTTPIIEHVNELDELTAKNTNEIRSVDARAQQGIQEVSAKATEADRKAATARGRADEAQTLASTAAGRANVLTSTVANLDNYRPVVETSVHFAFDKANLTSRAKKALDQLAAEVPNTKRYIIEIHGGADAVGDKNYNYQLSERRAASVIQYLASEHGIPAHKIFVIGLGEDKPIEENNSAAGRAKNRRVEVRLMTNTIDEAQTAQQSQR